MSYNPKSLNNLSHRWENTESISIPLGSYTARNITEALKTQLTALAEIDGASCTCASLLARKLVQGAINGRKTHLEVLSRLLLILEQDTSNKPFDGTINVRFGTGERNPWEVLVHTNDKDGNPLPYLETK